ncbi:hypothetical protein VUJ46_22270 [Chryseobacterium sp. MYb264]|uniref:hypothetical protein n=1 Tax=Chryseobacterium sp. MYb264 TaxID=2745153 RepID=UPI002E0F513C|nr:hypothetical protein VUJ46_22270 [Chryseobacterium sp. MYb264]
MDSKTVFLNTCHAIANQLEGFKIYEKGQRLKKVASDKDIFFEITFQSYFVNHSSHIMINPSMAVYSKSLKKWQVDNIRNEFCTGLIYANHIGYITPLNTWKKWNLAGLSFEKSVDEIARYIQKYVLPIFDIFDSKETAIDFLKNNGTKFNPYCEDSLGPLDFLLCHSDQETANQFFNHYIENCSYKGKIISFFDKLKTEKEIDLNHSEFADAGKIKLAFLNGLSIKI